MCVGFTRVGMGDVGVHESPSWESVCIWIL